jgi:hypothetical protein
VKLRGWPEIGPDDGVLLTAYVPYGITGIDDDDDDDDLTFYLLIKIFLYFNIDHMVSTMVVIITVC